MTYDFIVSADEEERIDLPPECIQRINDTYSIYYYNRAQLPPLSIEAYSYSSIPNCFGLLDTEALEKSGILTLQNQPALSLRGQGVLIGFIDTGIAYELACFRNPDQTTRIAAIWDQTAVGGNPPEGFLYGVEYEREQLNQALATETPLEVVPQRDENGHGTLLASIACGSEDPINDFVGAAPECELLVVKCKPAKQYLKEFYYIPENTLVYQENDIMAAVAYLDAKARSLGKPLVICLGLGTNNGSHSGSSVLSVYLSEVGGTWGRCVVIASGNEANARHHFLGQSLGSRIDGGFLALGGTITGGTIAGGTISGETSLGGTLSGGAGSAIPSVGAEEMVAVEIDVEQSMEGFYLELWANAPELFAVSVRAPGGAVFPGAGRSFGHQQYTFIFEGTTVEIDYRTVGRTRGDQLVFVRFDNVSRGIWTLLVYPQATITGQFHVWLPMTGMLKQDVFFLESNPENTLTTPSSATTSITVGGYQTGNGALYLESGRGYTTTGIVKPDFTAPAVEVQGVNLRGNPTTGTGTSVAAAITSGACAQLFEWGVVRGNNVFLNSVEIGNRLILGSQRDIGRTYPNTQWGYGKLDVARTLARWT